MQADAIPLLLRYATYKGIIDRSVVRLKVVKSSEEESQDALGSATVTMEVLGPDLSPLPRASMIWTFAGHEVNQILKQPHPNNSVFYGRQ